MKQYLKYWCSPCYPSDPSNDPPATYMYIYYYKVCMYRKLHVHFILVAAAPVRDEFGRHFTASIEAPLLGLCAVVCFIVVDIFFQKKIEICINKLKRVQKLYFLVLKG